MTDRRAAGETREQFLARYPRPSANRVLVQCACGWEDCSGWAWGFAEDLMRWETADEADPLTSSRNEGGT